jgi:hypothetical protein
MGTFSLCNLFFLNFIVYHVNKAHNRMKRLIFDDILVKHHHLKRKTM